MRLVKGEGFAVPLNWGGVAGIGRLGDALALIGSACRQVVQPNVDPH